MSLPPAILRVLLPATLAGLACRGVPAKDTSAATHAPQVQFAIVSLDGDSTSALDSVWSQNDDVDSVDVLISDAGGLVISSVDVNLVIEHRSEGDAVQRAAAAPEVISWVTLRNVAVDSLLGESRGRRLLTLRPSALQKHVAARGADLWVVSVNMSILLPSRPVTRSLELLWD